MDKWLTLHPKFKTALGLAIAGDGAFATGVWNGTGTWHEFWGLVAGSALAIVGTYFGSSNPSK